VNRKEVLAKRNSATVEATCRADYERAKKTHDKESMRRALKIGG
jgi:hypothetical protein